MSVRAHGGDRIEYSAFLRSYRQRMRATRAEVSDAVQRITASPRPGAVSVDGRRYYSATDPKLRRVRLRFHVRRSRTVSVTTCAR
jgi:hypothetical protein